MRRWVGGSLCAAYLALLTSKYFQWPFGDPGWEYGGIALVLWTIPWGFLTQMLGGVIGLIDRLGWLSDAVAFFLLVGVGGGANAGIILLLSGLRITRVVVKTLPRPHLGDCVDRPGNSRSPFAVGYRVSSPAERAARCASEIEHRELLLAEVRL